MSPQPTRRALIRGASIAAAAVTVTGVATANPATGVKIDRSAWSAAEQSRAAVYARDANVCARFNAAEASGTLTDALETEWDDSAARTCDADWSLFDTPAPDAAAIEWKIQMLQDHGGIFDKKIADRLIADLRAIAGEG